MTKLAPISANIIVHLPGAAAPHVSKVITITSEVYERHPNPKAYLEQLAGDYVARLKGSFKDYAEAKWYVTVTGSCIELYRS